MQIIACVDDRKGLLFNKRRQSKDLAVKEKILQILQEKPVWINGFSAALFDENVKINENFLDLAREGDFCFVENVSLKEYQEKIEKIYLFCWNRRYPADFLWDLPVETQFHLVSSEEFPGNSHEKITLEVWER